MKNVKFVKKALAVVMAAAMSMHMNFFFIVSNLL